LKFYINLHLREKRGEAGREKALFCFLQLELVSSSPQRFRNKVDEKLRRILNIPGSLTSQLSEAIHLLHPAI
jgi:hypothetical protein